MVSVIFANKSGNISVGNDAVIFTEINSPRFFFRSVMFVWTMVYVYVCLSVRTYLRICAYARNEESAQTFSHQNKLIESPLGLWTSMRLWVMDGKSHKQPLRCEPLSRFGSHGCLRLHVFYYFLDSEGP